MAETLMSMAEASKYTRPLTAGVQVQIVEEEPLLDFIHWKQLPAGTSSYEWFEESDLPTAAFRAVGGGFTADTGILVPRFETLAILGGEMELDVFIEDSEARTRRPSKPLVSTPTSPSKNSDSHSLRAARIFIST